MLPPKKQGNRVTEFPDKIAQFQMRTDSSTILNASMKMFVAEFLTQAAKTTNW